MNTTTYVIPTCFLNLAINDEVVGMEKEDFELWDWFLLRKGIKYQKGHWSYDEQEPYYSWSNDLNDIGGSVVEVQWVYMDYEVDPYPPNHTTLSFEDFAKQFNCKSTEVVDVLDAKAFDTGEIHFLDLDEKKEVIVFQQYLN